jgi:acetyl-CoA/propionyl-CoA carboxylase biotin carboxyl carrier protein
VNYVGAGTIEGLLQDDEWFFMEMNTRVQVEHCVTEMVTGIDIVKEGIRAAAGEPLSYKQEDVVLRGHAIECRINAEDVSAGFLPAPGRITHYREPAGPGVRVDSGVVAGSEIPGLYDPMIAKLIVHGVDREHARRRMLRALDEFEIGGLPTLLGFHRALLSHDEFVRGGTGHGLVESEELAARAAELTNEIVADSNYLDGRPLRPRSRAVEVGGRRFDVTLLEPEPPWAELARRRRERVASGLGGAGGDAVVSPMQGTVLKVDVADGDEVEAGSVVCVVEAMKMENEIVAHRAGTVAGLAVAPGDGVTSGQVICRVVAE